jgi:hypothetical protein
MLDELRDAQPPPFHLWPASLGLDLACGAVGQNPRFSAGMSSPVYALFRSMLQDTSARNEGSVFIDDAIRKRLLTGVSPPTMPRRPRGR